MADVEDGFEYGSKKYDYIGISSEESHDARRTRGRYKRQ